VAFNPVGKEVYKRRSVVPHRVKKEREEDYEERRERILSARKRNRSQDVIASIKKYSNIYAKFAENYSKTLDNVLEQSKNHLRNKAKDRRFVRKNADIDNIKGREMHHFLIA